jgi:hypothetical protein
MFAAIDRNMSSSQAADAAFMFIRHISTKNKKRRERLFGERSCVELCIAVRGLLSSKKLVDNTKIVPADFEILMNLISPNNSKMATMRETDSSTAGFGHWRFVTCNNFSKCRNRQAAGLFQKPTAFTNFSQALYLMCLL